MAQKLLRKLTGPRTTETRETSEARDLTDVLGRADTAREAAKWSDAATLYTAALELKPDSAPIWVQLGNMNKESGKYQSALSAYERALEITPKDSDIHLQIGHLFKLGKKREKANESYRKALLLDTANRNAYNELVAAGMLEVAQRITKRGAASSSIANSYIFDVSDLVFYLGHHAHLTGIQRVQCSIILSVVRNKLVDLESVQFISFDRSAGEFRTIKKTLFLELLDDLTLPENHRIADFNQERAKAGILFPDMLLNAVLAKGTATIILLGAAWVIPDYAAMIVNLKRKFGCRFAMVFHDFIPVYARETCDQGTAEVFTSFMDQIIELVDEALCVSQNTANDLIRYCAETDLAAPPVTVTRLGSGFSEVFLQHVVADEIDEAPVAINERYVLFVSTIEGRKNHDFALRIWRRMISEGVDVPQLVCVGRLGWRSENFFQTLIATNNLSGKVKILEDISDTQLDSLYKNCEFTIFPSLYEGWGLPVSESLDHGKVCVTTRAASLPEVAGDLGVYIPLDNLAEATAIVRNLVEDGPALSSLEARIALEYRPDTWQEVSKRVLDACSIRNKQNARSLYPVLALGVEYPMRNPRAHTHGAMGQQMRDIITAARQGVILDNLASPRRINDALLMRNGDWHEPESWGCWTKSFSATIEFAFAPDAFKPAEKLIAYLALCRPASREACEIQIQLSNSSATPTIRRLQQERQIIAVEFSGDSLTAGKRLENGILPVSVQLSMRLGSGEKSLPPVPGDTRSIGFGLRSLLVVADSDAATRLSILENIMFMKEL